MSTRCQTIDLFRNEIKIAEKITLLEWKIDEIYDERNECQYK